MQEPKFSDLKIAPVLSVASIVGLVVTIFLFVVFIVAIIVGSTSKPRSEPPLLAAGPPLVTGPNVNFEFAGEGPFTCSLNGSPPVPCTSPYFLTDLPPGPHRLEITSGDQTIQREWVVQNFVP